MDERQRHRRGMTVRRAVLGRAHVETALRRRTELDADFQDLITRYAWGEIWTRPGLPRRVRCLLTLAMMVALNRTEELRMHVRAARRIGVSADQIKEVLLQSAIYCGVPAAHAAFQVAAEVLAERATGGPRRAAKRRRRPRTSS